VGWLRSAAGVGVVLAGVAALAPAAAAVVVLVAVAPAALVLGVPVVPNGGQGRGEARDLRLDRRPVVLDALAAEHVLQQVQGDADLRHEPAVERRRLLALLGPLDVLLPEDLHGRLVPTVRHHGDVPEAGRHVVPVEHADDRDGVDRRSRRGRRAVPLEADLDREGLDRLLVGRPEVGRLALGQAPAVGLLGGDVAAAQVVEDRRAGRERGLVEALLLGPGRDTGHVDRAGACREVLLQLRRVERQLGHLEAGESRVAVDQERVDGVAVLDDRRGVRERLAERDVAAVEHRLAGVALLAVEPENLLLQHLHVDVVEQLLGRHQHPRETRGEGAPGDEIGLDHDVGPDRRAVVVDVVDEGGDAGALLGHLDSSMKRGCAPKTIWLVLTADLRLHFCQPLIGS